MKLHYFFKKHRSLLIGTYVLFFYSTMSAQDDSISTSQSSWNVGIGFDIVGYHMSLKGEPNIYFYNFGIRPYVGYFISERSELGAILEQRFQRTSFENEQNVYGTGIGYYYRYNFTQFDPLKWLSRGFPFTSFFCIEWEHQLSNYRYLYLTEKQVDQHPQNMTKSNGFINHHFLPKIGIKVEYFTNFFMNFQCFYSVVNTTQSDLPIRARISIEYTF